MVELIMWIIFGAVVGFIADYIDKDVHLSWLERTVVGVVGAVLGGTLYNLLTTGTLGLTAAGGFNLVSIIVAVVGALIALFLWKKFMARGTIV